MSGAKNARIASAILEASGYDPRRYVPGSLKIRGEYLDWTEKCSARCKHNGICNAARSGLITGRWSDKEGPSS